jgi:sugar-specific transcriptional regulator TrmB
MTNNGGGTPAISTEDLLSTASENGKLKSQIMTLESEKKKLETELDSTRKEFDQYKSGEADRVKTKIEDALRAYDAQVKADEARAEVVRELKSVMKEEDAETVLSTNPSIETIKSFVAIRKVELSKGVGSSLDSSNDADSEDVHQLVSELRGTRTVVRK